MVVDVRRAHWDADAWRTSYTQLPDEDWEEGMCGLAFKALYSFLDAASCWNDEVGDMLRENGVAVGKSTLALIRHDEQEITGLAHGDDIVILSDDQGQDFFEACLTKRYQYKLRER